MYFDMRDILLVGEGRRPVSDDGANLDAQASHEKGVIWSASA
jgi:hypothetical protein